MICGRQNLDAITSALSISATQAGSRTITIFLQDYFYKIQLDMAKGFTGNAFLTI
jgi:hypothetical protein